MTIYGQTLGVFKGENNECIRNAEKTKLHKIKTVVFYFTYMVRWRVFRHELRHYDVMIKYSWRSTRHSTTYAKSKRTIFFFILCRFVISPLRMHSLFSRLNTPKVWTYMFMWREIWISLNACNSTPFYAIEMAFSL